MSSSVDLPLPSRLCPDPKEAKDCDHYVWTGHKQVVASGTALSLPVAISAGNAVVAYSISVESYDIELSITLKEQQRKGEAGETAGAAAGGGDVAAEGEQIVLVDPAKIQKAEDSLRVNGIKGGPMVLSFRLSNEFSWIRDKVVSYRVEAWVPRPRLTLESALEARKASTALRVETAQKANEASERVGAASEAVTALERELALVQAKLSLARGTLEATREDASNAIALAENAAFDYRLNSLLAALAAAMQSNAGLGLSAAIADQSLLAHARFGPALQRQAALKQKEAMLQSPSKPAVVAPSGPLLASFLAPRDLAALASSHSRLRFFLKDAMGALSSSLAPSSLPRSARKSVTFAGVGEPTPSKQNQESSGSGGGHHLTFASASPSPSSSSSTAAPSVDISSFASPAATSEAASSSSNNNSHGSAGGGGGSGAGGGGGGGGVLTISFADDEHPIHVPLVGGMVESLLVGKGGVTPLQIVPKGVLRELPIDAGISLSFEGQQEEGGEENKP